MHLHYLRIFSVSIAIVAILHHLRTQNVLVSIVQSSTFKSASINNWYFLIFIFDNRIFFRLIYYFVFRSKLNFHQVVQQFHNRITRILKQNIQCIFKILLIVIPRSLHNFITLNRIHNSTIILNHH